MVEFNLAVVDASGDIFAANEELSFNLFVVSVDPELLNNVLNNAIDGANQFLNSRDLNITDLINLELDA